MICSFTINGGLDEESWERIKARVQEHAYVVRAETFSNLHKLIIKVTQGISMEELKQLIDPEDEYSISEDKQ